MVSLVDMTRPRSGPRRPDPIIPTPSGSAAAARRRRSAAPQSFARRAGEAHTPDVDETTSTLGWRTLFDGVRSAVNTPGARLRERARMNRDAVVGRRAPELDNEEAPAWLHVAAAFGSLDEFAARVAEAAQAAWRILTFDEIGARLRRAQQAGRIEHVPTREQIVFGGLDMLRFLFEPGARATDLERGIDLTLHRTLRLIGDPRSWVDPAGLASDLDQVVTHLTEQFHFNPAYDLQLLALFDGGFDALAHRCETIVDGTHPRAERARRRIPRTEYFERLGAHARKRGAGAPDPAPVFRSEDNHDNGSGFDGAELEHFMGAVEHLAELWAFLAYCSHLPRDPATLTKRYRELSLFPYPRAMHHDAR